MNPKVNKANHDFVEPTDAMDQFIFSLKFAQLIKHPDTENTFAAYQFITRNGFEVWINARNGVVIHTGKTINRA